MVLPVSNRQPVPQWRFLVDENLPRSLAVDLQALGYTAEHVYDIQMGGAKDPAVYAYAQSQHAIIVTGDKDFSNVLAYAPPHAGIVVVEVPDSLPPDARKRVILRELAALGGQSLENTLVIIEVGRARIRR
jgi:predicted nuclease of predicted toxin-antitoxin system